MFGGIYFASVPFAGGLVPAGAALTLAAQLTISVTAAADLRTTALLAAAPTITITAGADLVVPSTTRVGITIDGVDVRGRVRMKGVTIHDILNDAPNTCALVIEGLAPIVGQRLRITLGSSLVLFAGQVQSVDHYFEGTPQHVAWAITAIDDTARANARRPFGTWVDTSATTIALAITTSFAPDFSTAGIEADLPLVSIVFDGTDTFIACLSRLATAVGGYCKVEDGTIYLFRDDTAAPPDPIDATHPFLHDPPIQSKTDSSQLRTRVYGKGYGESIQADLAPGETLIPIEDGAQFSPTGGGLIAATTPAGAQSEQLTHTGVELTDGGTLVGPGAGPTTPPGVALADGSGIESGTHDYAYRFLTATGGTLPSPTTRVTIGALPSPPTAPLAGAASAGGGLNPGSHRYYAVFRTATGSTLPGPVSNAITAVAGIAPPASGPVAFPGGTSRPEGALDVEALYSYGFTFWDGGTRETVLSPVANERLAYNAGVIDTIAGLPAAPAGFQRCWYRTHGGASAPGPTFFRLPFGQAAGQFSEFTEGRYLIDIKADETLGPAAPTTDHSGLGTCHLSAIPVSPLVLVTHVDLYREFNAAGAATARLALSVTNGTTAADDALANASLGALVPATAVTANRANVTWPAGPSGVTNIELYRTAAGATALKKLYTVGSNTAGSYVDSTPDAGLTTDAPIGDTSGLTQPAGQVNPGAPALPVASPAPFLAAGGWVKLGGGQVVRYTGTSGGQLVGIPATGPGAITTTVLYGSQAIPAPMLVGVAGLTVPIAKGSAIHIWVQRDDLAAQAEQAARAGGDGVVEYVITDTRRGVESLTARCDADLALFARPIITVAYATRDVKTKSGKPVVVNLPSPAIAVVLTIQDVTITEIDQVPGVAPRYSVEASSVRFSLEDTLRRLVARGPVVGGTS